MIGQIVGYTKHFFPVLRQVWTVAPHNISQMLAVNEHIISGSNKLVLMNELEQMFSPDFQV